MNSISNAEQPKIKAGFLILSAYLLIINEPIESPAKNMQALQKGISRRAKAKSKL